MRIQAGWNFRKGQVFGTHRDEGKASKVVLDFYDRTGLGTFVRE